MMCLEFCGLGYWDSSCWSFVEGLEGHWLDLARIEACGVKSGCFEIFGHKGGHNVICHVLMSQGGLDAFYMLYVWCWKGF